MIYSLESVNCKDKLLIGAKAYSLSLLIKYGFNVPGGIVLDTHFCKNFINGDLSEKHFLKSISGILKNEPDALFAVRSSTSVEDSASFSYAGQFDTILNVKYSELSVAVRSVINSVSKSSVQFYTGAVSSKCKIKSSVIIQRMIQSEYSGVIFTTDPVFKDKSKIVVEIVSGLGENIVDGRVIPILYRVDKDCIDTLSVDNKISEKVIKDVCLKALKIESLFNVAVDIEFAIYKDLVYFLQVRPITTL